MASVAIMAGGAILNAVAFTGSNYLARFLSGNSSKAPFEGKWRHDESLEGYKASYTIYEKERTKLLDWIETRHEIKEQAKQNFRNTGYVFKLNNQAHQHAQIIMPKEPKFSDFHQFPLQKQGRFNFFWHKCSSAWIRRFSFSITSLVTKTHHPYIWAFAQFFYQRKWATHS